MQILWKKVCATESLQNHETSKHDFVLPELESDGVNSKDENEDRVYNYIHTPNVDSVAVAINHNDAISYE